MSLDDIEHRILRPIWRDPRIHYAVNCASIGCPDLFPEAITAANADAYLTRGARDYINDPRGAVVTGGRLTVSSIYKWFREDFGGTRSRRDRASETLCRPQTCGLARGNHIDLRPPIRLDTQRRGAERLELAPFS